MKAIPEMAVDTRLLAQRLRGLTPGETVSYDELDKAIGRKVRAGARQALYSARNIALREGIVTEAVRKVGIKRLTDSEIVGAIGGQYRERVRRGGRRAMRKLTSVDFEQLSPHEKVKHNAELSQNGALVAFAGDTVTRRIAAKVSKTASEPLALAHTLKLFSE